MKDTVVGDLQSQQGEEKPRQPSPDSGQESCSLNQDEDGRSYSAEIRNGHSPGINMKDSVDGNHVDDCNMLDMNGYAMDSVDDCTPENGLTDPQVLGMDMEGLAETDQVDAGIENMGSLESETSETEGEDLAGQLVNLQDMMKDMKDGFGTAMTALAEIQYGDQVLQEKVDSNKTQYEQQLTDVLQMVLSLKTEFSSVMGQLQIATDSQKSLHREVETLQYERDILLEELEHAGSISEHVRNKYHSGRVRPNLLNKSSDSTTLTSLLERARGVFHSPQGASPGCGGGSNGTSDHDSGVQAYPHELSSAGEHTPPSLVSPIVQSYIAGLNHENGVEDIPEENYESDSSLTVAVNKSLDLSRTLGDKVEIDNLDSSEDEGNTEENKENIQGTPAKGKSSVPSSPYRGTPRKIPPHERNVREVQRLRVAREVIETERKYCTSLWTILDHFSAPLKHVNIVSQKDINTMFPPSLSRIYEHHCDFLRKMEDRLANWKWQCVLGDVFARYIESSQCDLLLQYQSYVNEFPAALYHIKKLCRNNSRFKKYLRNCHRDPVCENLELGSFLLTPIQRMPRYVLLLKQLHKYTDLEHPDHYYIEQSLHRVGEFLNSLNASIETSMSMVNSDITPKPKRRFIRIGSLRSSSISSYKDLQMRSQENGNQTINGDLNQSAASSSGRLFQLSMLKESLSRKKAAAVEPPPAVSISHPVSAPVHLQKQHQVSAPVSSIHQGAAQNIVPHQGAPARNLQPSNSFNSDRSDRDRTFAGTYDTSTLPSRGERKRRRRRPKSAALGETQNVLSLPPGDYQIPRIDVEEEIDVDVVPAQHAQQRRGRRARPVSMLEQSSVHGYPAPPWPPIGEPPESARSEGPLSARSESRALTSRSEGVPSSSHSPSARSVDPALFKSMPDVSGGMHVRDVTADVHQSMPGINDYGIYGDDDEVDGDDSTYAPTVSDVSASRRTVKLSLSDRSQSHGDMLREGSSSPSQAQITMALARSLTEDQLGSPSVTSTRLRPKSSQPHNQPPTYTDTLSRPKSASGRPVKLAFSEGDNLCDVSVMSGDVSMFPGDTIKRKKKKKDKNKKLSDSFTEADKDKKKGTSIKDSIKNIFFRKRGNNRASKTLEVGVDPTAPLSPLEADTAPSSRGSTLPEGTHLTRASSSPHLGPSFSLPPGLGGFLADEADGDMDAAIPQDLIPYDQAAIPSSETPDQQGAQLTRSSIQPDQQRAQVGRSSASSFQDMAPTPYSSKQPAPNRRQRAPPPAVSITPPEKQAPPRKEQAPPMEETIRLTSVTTMEVTEELSSFEDENGDPCSAV